MKKVLLTFLWVILTCQFVNAQTDKIDSLKLVWESPTQIDSIRFKAGLDLYLLQFRQNLDTARATGQQLLEFSLEQKNQDWKATSLNLIGRAYAVAGEFRKALKYFQQTHEINILLEDRKATATSYSNIGTIYYELGNYTQALENLLAGLKISEELNDKPGLARVTNNLGNVYSDQRKNEKALEYYQYSLKIKKELGNKRALPASYNNIGLIYTNLKNHELALENLLKSAQIAEEVNDKKSFSRAYSNIGGAYSQQGEYAKALDYLNKSVQIKEEIGDSEGLPAVYSYRAKTFLAQKDFRLAIKDAEKALELSKKTGALLVQKESYECLSSAWEGLRDMQKSLEYFKLATTTQDSLINQEKIQEITRQEMQYQFDKQQLSDSIAFTKQKAEQELLFEKNLSKQRTTLYLALFGSFALLLFGGFYWKNKQKNKKLEQERNLVARLKQVDALKDQFLANTSHELRTPLSGIIGLSESLKDGVAGNLPLKAIENLDMITNSGKRLSHLVNDILDFSKLRNHDLELATRPVDIHSIADVVLKLSQPLIEGMNLKLLNTVPKEIALVEADENRVQQILHNLVGNAIKFTEKGTVEITASEKDKMLSISVSDTGIGIPKDKFQDIFKSFEQGDGSTQREYGGTGLGLSVTKQLIALHGGTIQVDSEVSKGSMFTFTLPISDKTRKDMLLGEILEHEEIPQLRVETDESTTSSDVSVQKQKSLAKVLIVDDEPINRRVLENHLAIGGYSTISAKNGDEALKIIEKGEDFSIVLLDVMMPGMSGYEVCEEIRKKYVSSELPIVLLTAKNRVRDLVAGFNVGANDYLTKPFSKNELLARLKAHLDMNGIHKATSKFVPTEFIKSVGRETITDVLLGDHVEKDVTVVFTDIREYTTLAEGMTPKQNFKFVNSYVGKMGPVIQNNKGFVNQYLGDGIMALFPHEAEHALQASIDMQQSLQEYNMRRISDGNVPISVGMGLHTGPLVMGIIGDESRNDTAIIADTVNTASRMEGVTKHYGANIIISEDSLATIKNKGDYHFRYLGKVQVKGKDNIIGIYECFDGDDPEVVKLKTKTLKEFEKGLHYYFNNQFPKASAIFDKVLTKNPKDKVSKYFMTKAAEYIVSGVPKDWEIVNTMHEK